MELKPGYKQTEVGVIPEDWDVKTFGECFSFLPTGSNSRSELSEYGDTKYIHYGDIHTKWSLVLDCDKDAVPLIQRDRVKNLPFLEDGDLVMADASEDFEGIGASVEIKNVREEKVVAGLHTLLLRGDKTKVADGYKAYITSIEAVKKSLISIATGISVYGISKGNLKSVGIPLSSTIEEQRTIAAALRDVDASISALEELIAKKRSIKQAAMQQLLTGKTRLPGFSGEWQVKTLGEIGSFKKGRNIPKNQLAKEGDPCVLYGEIYTKYDCVVKKLTSYISREVAEQATPIQFGDILLAGSGETAEEIGKCFAYIGTEKAYAGGDLIILSPKEADGTFLGYQLNSPMVCKQKAILGQGSSVVHIYVSGLATVEVPLPPLSEQQAIATVLSDMDAEIAALEQRRDKARALKQSMMQELLTGKTRLL